MPWFRCGSKKPGRFREGARTFQSAGYAIQRRNGEYFYVFIPTQHLNAAKEIAKEYGLRLVVRRA